jgi:hypothetical protein
VYPRQTIKSLAAILCLSAIGQLAQAAVFSVALNEVNFGDDHGETPATLSGVVTGFYNTASGVVTMKPGTSTFTYLSISNPAFTLLTEKHSNWQTGGMAYSASAYSCIEGNFSNVTNTSFCANYNFGVNGTNETVFDYSTMPGTVIFGGDDVNLAGTNEHYVLQGIYFAASTDFFDGSTLIMRSELWNTDGPNGDATNGIELVFAAMPVPVPAAAWLFASALIGLAGLKRKR